MFENTNPTQLFYQSDRQTGGNENTSYALKLFRSTLRNGGLKKLWAKITGRSNSLLDLNEIEHSLKVRGRHYAGIQSVLISQIHGSEGRVEDFDTNFHMLSEKTRDRWISVARARIEGTALPAVELIQVGDLYFVRDGHHRISVASALGEEAIDAEVTVWDVKGNLPWEKLPQTNNFAAQPA